MEKRRPPELLLQILTSVPFTREQFHLSREAPVPELRLVCDATGRQVTGRRRPGTPSLGLPCHICCSGLASATGKDFYFSSCESSRAGPTQEQPWRSTSSSQLPPTASAVLRAKAEAGGRRLRSWDRSAQAARRFPPASAGAPQARSSPAAAACSPGRRAGTTPSPPAEGPEAAPPTSPVPGGLGRRRRARGRRAGSAPRARPPAPHAQRPSPPAFDGRAAGPMGRGARARGSQRGSVGGAGAWPAALRAACCARCGAVSLPLHRPCRAGHR